MNLNAQIAATIRATIGNPAPITPAIASTKPTMPTAPATEPATTIR